MMIRRIVCGVTLLSLLLLIASGGLAASFTATMVQTKGGKPGPAEPFYLRDNVYRFRVVEDGRELIILVDQVSGKTRILVPAHLIYLEMDTGDMESLMNNPFASRQYMAANHEARMEGVETVEGLACDRQVITAQGKPVMTAWIAKDYAFPIKIKNALNGNLVELKHINPLAQQASMFQVPKDYRLAKSIPLDPPPWGNEIPSAPLMTPPFEQTLAQGQIIRIAPREGFKVKISGQNAGKGNCAFTSVPFNKGRPLHKPSLGTFNLSTGGITTSQKVSPQEADTIVVRAKQGSVIISAVYEEAPQGLVLETIDIKSNSNRVFDVNHRLASRLIIRDKAGDGKGSRATVRVFETVEKQIDGGGTQFLHGHRLVDETISLGEGQSRFWHFDAGQKAGDMDVAVLSGGVQVRTEQPEKPGLVPPSWSQTPPGAPSAGQTAQSDPSGQNPSTAAASGKPSGAKAADAKRMVLVLDASGSMWGQIKGKAKIEIAKGVLDKLIDGMPSDLQVGLYAYGHRTKGDCNDIEMLAPVAPLDRSGLKKKIAAISPKGKTPLSESVRQAAKTLRYTEERATVVLVSDGLETCDVDPCALAEELAMGGVDFTVHVIGFDISEAEQEQLRCLADKTGGLFLAAADADALQKALTQTVAKVEEPPAPVKEDPGTAQLNGPASVPVGSPLEVAWQGPDSRSDYISIARKSDRDFHHVDYAYTKKGSPALLTAPAEPGDYELRYVHAHSRTVIGRAPIKVTPVQATVQTQASADVATEVEVAWQGPAYKWDYISISRPDQKPGQYVTYTYTREGSPLKVRAPSEAGTYEVRYILGRGSKLLAKTNIEIKGVGASVKAPESADVATEVEVIWQGPGNKEDYISISQPDQKPGQYVTYTYTREGSPLKVRAPSDPGTYEVRYILGRGSKLLAKTNIEIKGVGASVKAPESADVATKFEVAWQGPGNKEDYISISRLDQKPGQYVNYTYTREGSPLKVRAPSEAGTYEVRYILGRGSKLLAKTTIDIKAVSAAVQPAKSAAMASHFEVAWNGPGNKEDYICVSRLDQKPGQYINYTYTREGSPLKVRAPNEPGTYEVRYILGRGSKLLAKTTIDITPVTAEVDPPATGQANTYVEVAWKGPGYKNDFISIALPDQKEGQYKTYAYTNRGNPCKVKAPKEPGTYEVRYILGYGSKLLAKKTIKIE